MEVHFFNDTTKIGSFILTCNRLGYDSGIKKKIYACDLSEFYSLIGVIKKKKKKRSLSWDSFKWKKDTLLSNLRKQLLSLHQQILPKEEGNIS